MTSRGRKILHLSLLVLLVAYAVVAIRYCTAREAEQCCVGIEITVRDSSLLQFVTPELVHRWLIDSVEHPIVGSPLHDIDIYALERLIERQSYVAQADAYTAIDGLLHVVLSQRCPVLRITTDAGHNFYLDSTLLLLPPQTDCIADVPIVTGRLPLGFPPDYFGPLDEKKFPRERELLHNLLNFVHQVDTDRFLDALIAQIYYDGRELRLLPRVGRQTIRFGAIADSAATGRRLRKLSRFYRSSFAEGWWRTATEIDLRFRGQVVCKGMPVVASPEADGPGPNDPEIELGHN